MRHVSCALLRAKARLFPILVVGLLAAAGLSVLAQTTGGRAVSFGTNIKISGLPSDPAGTDHWETSIAANPTNPSNLVTLYMHLPPTIVAHRPCYFSVTHDGGATWSVAGAAPLRNDIDLNGCSDPSVAADAQGAFYLAYLDENHPAGSTDDWDIRVARSTDGGNSFPTSSVAFSQGPSDVTDRPYIAADAQPNSPFRGSLYVTYVNLVPEDAIQVVVSRDGAGTWSAPITLPEVRLPEQPFLDPGLPVVAPDGT